MKKVLVFFLLVAFSAVAYAQGQDTLTVYSPRETAAELNKPEKYPLNWFVGVGGGFNMATDVRSYSTQKTGNGTGISVDVYAGKWLNRYFGSSLGYHGINTSFNDVNLSSRDHGSHPFFYLHANALFRPTTWLVPYVHAGYINVTHTSLEMGVNNKHKHAFGGGAGIMFPIRAGRFRVVPGVRVTMMSGNVGTYEDTPQKELRIKFSATIGLAYTFGRQKARVIREVTEVPYEVLRIDTVHVHTHSVDTVYIQRELDAVAESINSRTQADVLFDLNSAHLRPDAYPILQEVLDFLKENPEVHATIEGHACILGFDSVNQPLSERRAQAVYDYLHGHGIPFERLDAKGYGSKRPKTSNETEHGRRLNRRIEFVFRLK